MINRVAMLKVSGSGGGASVVQLWEKDEGSAEDNLPHNLTGRKPFVETGWKPFVQLGDVGWYSTRLCRPVCT
jgi:hypothetical protein